MKKRTVKALGLFMAAVLAFGMVGCGSKKDEEASNDVEKEESEDKDAEADKEEEKEEEAKWTNDASAEITILMAGDNTPNEDNIVIQALEEATGTQISMIYVPGGDYDTKLNALIAAGTYPDIWSAKNISDAQTWKDAGLLADMTDVLNAVAPNVIEETKDVIDLPAVNKDGIYMVMNTALGYAQNVNIRTDWLENLGLEMPTTLEEYAEVLHAFTYDDPDGNGVDDTFGLSFNMDSFGSNGFANVFGAYGIAAKCDMEIDGVVTTWVKHPNYLEAMKYIKSLIDDGVCEPDYLTIPNMDMFGKFWNGTSGAMEWECVGPTNNWMPGRYVEDPVPTFGFATLAGPDGTVGTAAKYPIVTSGWVFSATSKNLEGCAKIANFCMSEEGSDLLRLGVEGVMYNWVDKEAGTTERLGEYTDDANHRADGAFCYWALFKPANNAEVRTFNAQTQEGTALAWGNPIDWAYVTEASEVYAECGADMDQLIKEMHAELLQTPEDEMQEVYDEYIAEWEAIGGSDWEEEVTALYAAQSK